MEAASAGGCEVAGALPVFVGAADVAAAGAADLVVSAAAPAAAGFPKLAKRLPPGAGADVEGVAI